jgi:2-hydroxychromene-2-carboxylate isomerase
LLVQTVAFYFDYACPWSYLACVRLRDMILRSGAVVDWKPLLLADLAEVAGPAFDSGQVDDGPRARYQEADLAAWAHYNNVRIHRRRGTAPDCRAALRGLLAAKRHGRAMDYSLAVFAACHGACEDISDAGLLVNIAVSAGMDREDFSAAIAAPDNDQLLAENARELVQRGGYGSATLFVDEQMFFGHMRMPLVEFALGQASSRQFVMPGQHG